LPFGYSHPQSDENGDSTKSDVSLVDEQKDHVENMGRYRASYMGVCQLPKSGAMHRRIDIKVRNHYNLEFMSEILLKPDISHCLISICNSVLYRK
jgi:hypothetical protein